jgi:aldehyde:ferredoxin oxidoreductase
MYGYAGKILRVDLSTGDIRPEELLEADAKKFIGGTGLGAKFLYEEVPPGVEWSDPENRMIWATGPLGGTKVSGTGTFSVVTKGPMTNLAGATQANGFLGAFLKFSGFDALVIQGAAPQWSYLYIHDGKAELRGAIYLLGKDTWETEEAIAEELGLDPRRVSVYSIGPAGENLVRFASLMGDRGHVAAHNGVGAVMGSKRLKAVAVARGRGRVPIADPKRLSEASKKLFEHASTKFAGGTLYKWGTGGLLGGIYATGMLPVKNYTTNIFPEHDKIDGQYLRTHFEERPKPCWACRVNHVRYMKVTEGPYAGFEGEEPEYEQIAAWGPQIGQTDAGAIVMLANTVDRLGLDCNESSWLMGWLMECYERGILTKDDLDGLEMTWGNVEAVRVMLHRIARREGCGDWLAEGVMRASRRVGGEAPNIGIYTLKGATPRGHDHRGRWYELLDTCLSNTSTIEASFGLPPELPGKPKLIDPFSPEEISTVNAVTGGWRQFEDCLGICRFCSTDPVLTLECVNAATGWNLTVDEALDTGRRVINLLRMFNFRHGLDPNLEAPSPRYSSTPVDGPAQGISIAEHFDWMKQNYWKLMGWDTKTGRPLPETLKELGLEELIADLR